MEYIRLQAHCGVESEYPKNTMSSFRAAAEQKYDTIELDLGITKDKVVIVMHDEVINTTGRNPDGSRIGEKIRIDDITYEEAMQYDFGIWFDEKFKGEKLPKFEDVLKLSREHNIPLKIDNKIRRFTEEDRRMTYRMMKDSGAPVGISCWSMESMEEALREIPNVHIHFDGLFDEEQLKYINEKVGKERFTVWLPYDENVAWIPREWFATKEKCERVKKYANLGIWAIKDKEMYEAAVAEYHPQIVETKGNIKH